MLNYAIKFAPILKERIWGGSKLRDVLHKETTLETLGESWEISGVQNEVSIVDNGPLKGKSLAELIEEYSDVLLGMNVHARFQNEFPLLIKYIDANTALSVQLHPNDEIAKRKHNSFGKTEMWYVMQADEGAELNIGFQRTLTREEYVEHLNSGRITEVLNFEQVEKGDAFFINTGKVHAIGAGVLLAEIQQTSDITYRIFDYNRTDAEGKSRELHTELALEAIDYEKKDDYRRPYGKEENAATNIADCQYFTTNYLPVKGEALRDYSDIDSFVIYMCVGGKASVEIKGSVVPMQMGETVLIPAVNKEVKLTGEGELLEVYISNPTSAVSEMEDISSSRD